MSTTATPVTAPSPAAGAPVAAPVLVATSGAGGAGALRLAWHLAARGGQLPVVVTVLDELPVGLVGSGLGPLPPTYDEMRHEIRRDGVERQLREVLGAEASPPLLVVDGEAASSLAAAARERHAALLVLGSRRPERGLRLLAGETALRTIRRSPCPVLVVPERATELPTVAVAAMDFSPSSVAAARAALRVLAEGATLHLVHVWTRLEGVDDWMRDRYARYAERLPERWERVLRTLQVGTGVTVTTTALEMARPERHVPETLLAHAESVGAGLLVVGRRRRGLLERMLIGSVTTGLVRGARCAVLAVPPPSPVETEALARSVSEVVESEDPDEWVAQLDAFTRRPAGRRAPRAGCAVRDCAA